MVRKPAPWYADLLQTLSNVLALQPQDRSGLLAAPWIRHMLDADAGGRGHSFATWRRAAQAAPRGRGVIRASGAAAEEQS
jgi:hypothetical protein